MLKGEAFRKTILHGLSTILNPILRAFEFAVTALAALMVAIVFSQVCLRYIFNSSFYGSEELARYLFTWFVFVGSACALDRNLHFTVDVVVGYLPAAVRLAIQLAMHVVVLVILGVIMVTGIDLTIRNWEQLSSSMRIPLSFPYAAIPISAAVMILVTLRKLAILTERRYSLARSEPC